MCKIRNHPCRRSAGGPCGPRMPSGQQKPPEDKPPGAINWLMTPGMASGEKCSAEYQGFCCCANPAGASFIFEGFGEPGGVLEIPGEVNPDTAGGDPRGDRGVEVRGDTGAAEGGDGFL